MSGFPKSMSRLLLGIAAVAVCAVPLAVVKWSPGLSVPVVAPPGGGVIRQVALQERIADPFEGGVAWLNTGGPIRLKDLRGKIVILDFWTYCCINCHHILPALAKLEEKYKDELVVIGVHTPKFIAERDVNNVRQKVREYAIKHPVVCDSDQVIWNNFGVESWPTIVAIGPDGVPIAKNSGEISFEALDNFMTRAVAKFKGELNLTPVKFFPENEKPDNTPLLYPGKVLADAKSNRLFIADTGHNRYVMTDLDGKNPVLIGSGTPGLADGSFEKAEFHRPQGMTLVGDVLYAADTENHALRAIDLKSRVVTTLAGNGTQAHTSEPPGTWSEGKRTELNSPWDIAHVEGSRVLYVAMAGPHQIWHYDLKSGQVGAWAGTSRENIIDGPIASAAFAQPSGLATDGHNLFVADSEVSALRSISLVPDKHNVHSIVGEGLFEFGDVDGRGNEVRLQHCLGVSYADGKLYVADTYNNKIKVCDPKSRAVKAIAGTGKPGDADGAGKPDADKPAKFYQPGGLSVAGNKLFVADSNNHKIRVVDLRDDSVTTLNLNGLSAPAAKLRKPVFRNVARQEPVSAEVKPGESLAFDVTLPISDDFKLNEESAMPFLVEAPDASDLVATPVEPSKPEPPTRHFTRTVTLSKPLKAGESLKLKFSVSAFVCNKGSNFCTIKSYAWDVNLKVSESSASSTVELKGVTPPLASPTAP